MLCVLTPEQMRKADSTAIGEYHISSQVLMENAARSAADFMRSVFEIESLFEPDILILCGSGNNGGDGFALARHLSGDFHVRVVWIGSADRMSPETLENYRALLKMGLELRFIDNEAMLESIDFKADCIVDALIGVGGSENIKGMAVSILKKIECTGALKIAIDAPTGLNTLNGEASEYCFDADYTVTMFAPKTGMYVNKGPDFCGNIFPAYLGAPENIIEEVSEIRCIEHVDLPFLLPGRQRISSKFDYGRVMIIAGSGRYPGAAALCGNAAIYSGAGLVELYSTAFHPALLPEVIQRKLIQSQDDYISYDNLDYLLENAEKSDVIVFGPGLGNTSGTIKLAKEIIGNMQDTKKMVIDADALRAIDANSKLTKNIILTPHSGEFSGITGIGRNETGQNSWFLVKEWAERLNCIIHLKHVPSISSDGCLSYWNIGGNPGMASGGSGDVLSGIIGAMAARGLPSLESAALGAFLHSVAGDSFAEEYSEESLTASGLLDRLKYVFPNYSDAG